VEADEGHILDGDLQELQAQLVGLLVLRGELRHLVDYLGGFLVVPAGALAASALAQRHDQVGVPAVDLRVDVLGDAAGRPVAGDLEVARCAVGIPGGAGFAGQRAVKANFTSWS
jgi:hypothetical protein